MESGWRAPGGAAAERRPHRAEDLLRDLAPQVVGILTRRSGDFTAAEDAVQEALVAAHTTWPRDGIPDHPRGVARHRRRPGGSSTSSAARQRVAGANSDWAAARPDGRRGRAARRLPHRPAHVLPPGPLARLGGGAHPARRGRADDGRDRHGLPRARTDDGATHLARQAHAAGLGGRRSSCPPPTSSATGCGARWRWSTSSTTRGMPRAPVPT